MKNNLLLAAVFAAVLIASVALVIFFGGVGYDLLLMAGLAFVVHTATQFSREAALQSKGLVLKPLATRILFTVLAIAIVNTLFYSGLHVLAGLSVDTSLCVGTLVAAFVLVTRRHEHYYEPPGGVVVRVSSPAVRGFRVSALAG